jgi:hypothetical protein
MKRKCLFRTFTLALGLVFLSPQISFGYPKLPIKLWFQGKSKKVGFLDFIAAQDKIEKQEAESKLSQEFDVEKRCYESGAIIANFLSQLKQYFPENYEGVLKQLHQSVVSQLEAYPGRDHSGLTIQYWFSVRDVSDQEKKPEIQDLFVDEAEDKVNTCYLNRQSREDVLHLLNSNLNFVGSYLIGGTLLNFIFKKR